MSMPGDGMQNETVTNITSYDVLVDPSVEGVVGEYQLDNYSKNVGNNRLKVFLTLYKQDYDRARRHNDIARCESIADEILHTLNTKCVPTGRFLINSASNPNDAIWNLMGEYQSKQLIHGMLFGVLPPASYLRQQHQIQEHQAVEQCNSNSNGNNEAEEHKRRRRSSLLRRSTSDSFLNDSKKVLRYDHQLQNQRQEKFGQDRRMSKEEPIWSSSRQLTANGVVSLNRMDVILTSNRKALDPNCQSIGNNRLHILVAMQSGKYQLANDRQKEAILDEVIQTVNSFWKGRFLTESIGGSYELLDNADAKRSLRNIFDMRSGQNLFSQSSSPAINIPSNTVSSRLSGSQLMGRNSGIHALGKMNISSSESLSGSFTNAMNDMNDANRFRQDTMNAMRHASASSLPVGNTSMISNDTKKILRRQLSSSVVPNLTQSKTLPNIEPPVGLSGIDDLRSAAIKSLQKQKARQQVANRLEKVAMRNSQQQLHQQFQQPNNANNTNGVNYNSNGNMNFSSFSMGGGAKRRQSSIFGALDPSMMDEIVSGCFDDEDD